MFRNACFTNIWIRDHTAIHVCKLFHDLSDVIRLTSA